MLRKIKRESLERLFFKPIIVYKDDMDKFNEQKMKIIKQIVRAKKPKIIRDKLKGKIINDIWTLFETEEKKEDRKKHEKHNENRIKHNENKN